MFTYYILLVVLLLGPIVIDNLKITWQNRTSGMVQICLNILYIDSRGIFNKCFSLF